MRISTFACLALASAGSALSPAGWRAQSIYQVVTDRFARTDGSTDAVCDTEIGLYCGGTWMGLVDKLDYIQGMGFTALWISPVVENLEGNTSDGSAYHGYWAQNIYELNSNFGTKDDLINLSAALHSRGMYLMVDVVTNHMGYVGRGDCVDYSVFTPFNEQSNYHDFCLINYDDANTIKTCWMGDSIVSLPDLRTEDSAISSIWNSWITDLVANYSIDGLRLDSAQQVNNEFFTPFQSAAGVYMVGEVFNGDPNYVCPYQNYMSGVLNYPAYFWIKEAFQSTSGSISNLVNGINTMKSACSDTTLLGSFLENHDLVRFPSLTSDISLTKNAIAFSILQDGIPIVYYGQEQQYNGGDVPYDREALWFSQYSTTSPLYRFIASVNQIRNQAIYKSAIYSTYKAYPTYSDTSVIAMRKESLVSVFTNQGASGGSYTLTLSASATGFAPAQALVEVLSCTSYTADAGGNLAVAMAGGLPRVFYPAALLEGSEDKLIAASVPGTSMTSTAMTATGGSWSSVTFEELVVTAYGTGVKYRGK